jgi:putative tricarboxylic transport membrane protein
MNMSEKTETQSRPWWLGLGVIAIGAFWIYGALQLPQTATYAKVGPGMFVSAAGIGLVLLGLLLLVQIARGEKFEPVDAEDIAAGAAADWPALWTAIAAASVPLYTMERFGFIVSATLMFVLTTRAFGSRRLLFDLALGFLIAGVCWYGFNLLGVNLGDPLKIPKSAFELVPSLKPW